MDTFYANLKSDKSLSQTQPTSVFCSPGQLDFLGLHKNKG